MNSAPRAEVINRSRNVAVLVNGFDNWGGGLDFLRLILNGLIIDPAVTISLLVPRSTIRTRARSQAGALWRTLRSLLEGHPVWHRVTKFHTARAVAAFADFGNRVQPVSYVNTRVGLMRALDTCKADVVLPTHFPLGRDFPVPWVGYIFDFQHKYLPDFFSEKAREARDEAFAHMFREADVVLANANTVREDSEKFFPGSGPKIVCLPFAPSPKPDWFRCKPSDVQAAYALPTRYFIVCNQLWLHKDHATAIRAFAAFKAHGHPGVGLVCTGELHDPRAPRLLSTTRRLIDELDLSHDVHLLGHIPKTEQVALLRGAVAVLQPTLFEGGPGGGAVYDAVALGVPALVSDIPVNREVIGGVIDLFPARDHLALARLMEKAILAPAHQVSEERLLREATSRLTRLNETLHTAIDRACIAHVSARMSQPR